MPVENKEEIKMKVCPQCEAPIVKTKRYRNIAKSVFYDIPKIRYYVFNATKNYGYDKEYERSYMDRSYCKVLHKEGRFNLDFAN